MPPRVLDIPGLWNSGPRHWQSQWETPERVRAFATAWGAELVEAGALGHINSDSDLGLWPLGQQLVQRLSRGP